MWWLFPVGVLVTILSYTTDLNASSFNTTEIAKCMIEKSPYSGSFNRWDYLDYCGGAGLWDMTSPEMMQIQCMIGDHTRMYNGTESQTDATCECTPPDHYDGDNDDQAHRPC